MKKIDVNLYGGKSIFGGKETKLEAVTLYCDRCATCSLYKEGKCLNVRSLSASCKFGKRQREEGYTSRAAKYYSWKEKFKNDPVYNKLEYPHNVYIAEIDNFIFINTGYLYKNEETGKYRVDTMLFNCGWQFVPKEDFTNELLNIICSGKPRTIMDYSVISSYQEKIIPNFLYQFKKLMPERFKEFVSEYPQYKEILPNFVGKFAYIKTMPNGVKIKDCHGNILTKQDNKLICDNYHGLLPFSCKTAKIEVEIDDKATYEVRSNDEVDENTEFKY